MHLFVIPCGGAKLDRPAAARDLYTGSMFRQVLAAVEEEAAATARDCGEQVRVMILSALHGLVDLDQVLEPYDVTMTSPDAISVEDLADQFVDLDNVAEVWAFLPAAYYNRLRAAADLAFDDGRSDNWVAVNDVYEAAPGIGYQKRVVANLRRLEVPAGVDLKSRHVVLFNSSAGKDSQAGLSALVRHLDAAGVDRARVVVVHADLGRVEWPGTRELAEEQAAAYGLRFEVVRRERGDLLEQIEARGKFPASQARYCTSDQKTDQVAKLITRLVAEYRAANPDHEGPVRVLNCLGIRADESADRAKKTAFGPDPANWSYSKRGGVRVKIQHGLRVVDRWLPIFTWDARAVWMEINRSGLRYHHAYDLGMPRLSCVFCVFAGPRELAIAARHNPELAAEYVAVEARIGHTFQSGRSMAEIVANA